MKISGFVCLVRLLNTCEKAEGRNLKLLRSSAF
jgi:hypothetical protein